MPPRRYGEKLLQNSDEVNNPSKPPAMTMIATVLLLHPVPAVTPPRRLGPAIGATIGRCYRPLRNAAGCSAVTLCRTAELGDRLPHRPTP